MAREAQQMFPPGVAHPSNRREFLRSIGVLAAAGAVTPTFLAACGGSSDETAEGAATAIATQFAWVKNVEWAGFWVADDQGYFEEEGLDVEFLGGGPNAPEPTQVVTGGRAQVGVSSDMLVFFDAVRKGADLVMFATDYQESPLGLMWLPDSGIEGMSDLVGKRIGGDQDSRDSLDALFTLNGEPADYELVPIGFDPSPLVENEIDAMVCFVTNQPLILEAEGLDPIAKTNGELGLPLYADVLYAPRDLIEANREQLGAYLRALIRGWEKNLEDPTLAAHLVVDEYGIDLGSTYENELAQNEAQNALVTGPETERNGLLSISEKELAGPMYDALEAIGANDLPPVDQVLDLSILEAAKNGA